jgi:hypothetical protein
MESQSVANAENGPVYLVLARPQDGRKGGVLAQALFQHRQLLTHGVQEGFVGAGGVRVG